MSKEDALKELGGKHLVFFINDSYFDTIKTRGKVAEKLKNQARFFWLPFNTQWREERQFSVIHTDLGLEDNPTM